MTVQFFFFFASTYNQLNATLPGMIILKLFTKDSTHWQGRTERVLPEGSWLQVVESEVRGTWSADSPLESSPSCFTSRKYSISLAVAKEKRNNQVRLLPSRHLVCFSVRRQQALNSEVSFL